MKKVRDGHFKCNEAIYVHVDCPPWTLLNVLCVTYWCMFVVSGHLGKCMIFTKETMQHEFIYSNLTACTQTEK